MKKTIQTTVIIFLSIFVLSGCTVKFIYNQLDWLIPWYFDRYLDLEGEQEDVLDDIVERQLEWHRRHELPRYAAYLRETHEYMQDGLSKAELLEQNEKAQALWDAMIQHLMPDIVDLMSTLSQEQLEHLYENFDDDLDDFREEYIELSEEKIRKRHAKDTEKFIKFWVGRLSDDQEDMIDEWAYKQYVPMEKDLFQYQLRWRERYIAAMKERGDRERLKQELTLLLMTPEDLWPKEYQKMIDHNTELSQNLFIRIDGLLSEKQRNKALDKLADYAEDFDQLSEQD